MRIDSIQIQQNNYDNPRYLDTVITIKLELCINTSQSHRMLAIDLINIIQLLSIIIIILYMTFNTFR